MMLRMIGPLAGRLQCHPLQTVLSSDSPCPTAHSMTQQLLGVGLVVERTYRDDGRQACQAEQ